MSDPELRDPRLDQAYRALPGDEPPPEVDERIRAAARRAVGARPQSLEAHQRSWASRWRVPLSLAASVVVVATLTVMMQEEEQRVLYRDPAPAPQAPAAIGDRAAPRAAEEAKPRDTEAARSKPAAPPPVAAEPQRATGNAVTAPPPQLEKLETRQQRLEDSRPAPAAPAATPAPPKPSPLAAPPAAPSSASDSLSRERAVGERPARATRSVARPPEDWIEEIRRLKTQGRDADAATELAEFRRRYPEYPLPVDLAR